MPKLTLNIEALVVQSFPVGSPAVLVARPTTTDTRHPGCTTPELGCGTVIA